MNDEAAFLAAVDAAPHDSGLRLVYADWLDERGDPRGELVRVEEEMGRLPVFSDRFWELKPRRNELRSQAAPDWLTAMRYGTDCKPVFGHGVPDDWKGRWRLIREFVERWHRFPMPDVGGRAEEIRETEERLERTLPPSVREWVAFAHDLPRNERFLCVLRDVYQMQDLVGFSAISLLLQCENDYHWAVRHMDVAMPDPPVQGFHWDFESIDVETFVPDRANPIATSVTDFALRYVIGYTRGLGGGFGTSVSDAADLIRELDASLPVRCLIGESMFYEAENLLVRLQPSEDERGRELRVEVAKPMGSDAPPAFLWEYTNRGGSFHGMFIPDNTRNPEMPP